MGIQALDLNEIRRIADGKIDKLADFVSSYRIHAVDPKGDTPLHLAARMGNLALCDFFICAGADATLLNHDQQTAGQVAFAEGHIFVGQLLSSLVASELEFISAEKNNEISEIKHLRIQDVEIEEHQFHDVQKTELNNFTNNLDDLVNFQPELEPEKFLFHQAATKASGAFVALGSLMTEALNNKDADWHVDLLHFHITGDGIGSSVALNYDFRSEHDFLKVRNRGRLSLKRTIIQTGTKLSIKPANSINWSVETLEKGWCSFNDVNQLAEFCEGNGDIEEIRINLNRTLEAAGLEVVDQANRDYIEPWDALTDISSDELAEAIEGNLTRATRLPGTERFVMDKSDEAALLEPMVKVLISMQK